jgi:hypothetical protein
MARHSPLMFPVKAGFTLRGEEKNCEKLGSCACDNLAAPNSISSMMLPAMLIDLLPVKYVLLMMLGLY